MTDPTLDQVRDRIAAEYQRRRARYDSGELARHARHQVAGELIGLLAALGITLGEHVPGGEADIVGRAYYEQWLTRQDALGGQPDATTDQHIGAGQCAEQQVKRLDQIAEAWATQLPEVVRAATVVDAVHTVTRPNGERP